MRSNLQYDTCFREHFHRAAAISVLCYIAQNYSSLSTSSWRVRGVMLRRQGNRSSLVIDLLKHVETALMSSSCDITQTLYDAKIIASVRNALFNSQTTINRHVNPRWRQYHLKIDVVVTRFICIVPFYPCLTPVIPCHTMSQATP